MHYVPVVTFTPSVAPDVASHNLVLFVDGVQSGAAVVPVGTNEREFLAEVQPGQVVRVVAVAVDHNGNQSQTVETTSTVPNFPDTTAPEPPTNLAVGFRLVE